MGTRCVVLVLGSLLSPPCSPRHTNSRNDGPSALRVHAAGYVLRFVSSRQVDILTRVIDTQRLTSPRAVRGVGHVRVRAHGVFL